ncbi:peptidoglycan-N-acetylglucosamine deacetylase [Bacillus toyonensis]|uniref:peptidoglycan-N-acetylglucosamine deacetylase n=1 Tax=Bacillus toyonensis TaxID=155322 RepID=UPI003AA978B5
MEKAFNMKRVVVVLIAVAAVAIGYFMFQSITSPAKAVAKQENVVQLASEQSKVELNKTAPSRFNGKERKVAYLTFDDGPDLVFTPKILDKLKQHNVKATFFLLGENAEKFPNVVKRIANEGHVIGNHTYSHPNLAKVNEAEYHNQIIKTEEILNRLAGYAPKFIRPPYGEILENQLKWATEQNFMIVQWSVDTVDWKGVSADTITNNVLGNSFPGSVILQHSTPGGHLQGSVDALDKIIPQLKTKGARFVTLPSMFQTSKERK